MKKTAADFQGVLVQARALARDAGFDEVLVPLDNAITGMDDVIARTPGTQVSLGNCGSHPTKQ